tara:strand:+ start:913 stop:1437 length:525 start_codon:yes stop_codon:yes gene_type:complete
MKFSLLLLVLISCTKKEIQKPVIETPTIPTWEVVRFKTNSNLEWLKEVVKVSNCVIKREDFLKEVEAIKSFYFSTDNGVQVANTLRSSKVAIIDTYSTFNPWSKVNAYRDVNTGLIYLNLRNNPRTLEAMVDTFLHERSHNWYNHNGNLATGDNLNSVPYTIGRIAQKYVRFCK